MSGNQGTVDVDADGDALYHVRLIQKWPPPLTSPPLDKTVLSSFYGLQLELRGTTKDLDDPQSPITLFNDGQTVSKTGAIKKAIAAPLHFGSSPPSTALLAPLEAIVAPFEIIIRDKVSVQATGDSIQSATMDDDARSALQQMTSVQAGNSLLEINGDRFLAINGDRFLADASVTGADIYRRLWIVASRATLATPYELTLRRHNLPQASAKIVPFARRKDVQGAQVAQLAKLAAQESALPLDIRRKKLFLVQQLDFEREHYLVAYLSDPLQELYTKVMGGCQWQAYEFDKTIWYFHAPTTRLYAQHPLRSHPEARELIERVQQQVQQAVRRLQRRTRSWQRRKRLMNVVQAEIKRREEEKKKINTAVRRIQHRIRVFQRRKRFLAIIEAEKRRLKKLQREQQLAEERRQGELRDEEHRFMESMKQERERLLQELSELKLELQQLRLLKETKLPVQSETQTTARHDEDGAIEQSRKEEQLRVQQRLDNLELELQKRKQVKPVVESETQTSSRNSESDATQQLKHEAQQQAQQTIKELQLQLRYQNAKQVVESVTQTSGRLGNALRDEGVDTGDDLEWQRYLTLLRVAVKKKKASPKSRHTQTECFDGEATLLASSMLRAPQNAVSFSPSSRKFTGEWKGFPSWQRNSNNSGSSSNYSSTSSLLTLKSSVGQLDELDAMSPPTRTFESFFAPGLVMTHDQPPPPLVEHPWRQDSTFLPLKSSRKLLEITPIYQPLHEFEDPIRPVRTNGNSSPLIVTPASSPTNPTKLPYITRRRKEFTGPSS
ncbi:unnamed protein product [Phytophthora lilii]|uniref:Unnamed protein product n=1 Tax=Phytophthora lilii TaxID=2077276 RepID=A0A9W6WZV7_9STRA|nr:unnamed protein product [Phytophthora lilii]